MSRHRTRPLARPWSIAAPTMLALAILLSGAVDVDAVTFVPPPFRPVVPHLMRLPMAVYLPTWLPAYHAYRLVPALAVDQRSYTLLLIATPKDVQSQGGAKEGDNTGTHNSPPVFSLVGQRGTVPSPPGTQRVLLGKGRTGYLSITRRGSMTIAVVLTGIGQARGTYTIGGRPPGGRRALIHMAQTLTRIH